MMHIFYAKMAILFDPSGPAHLGVPWHLMETYDKKYKEEKLLTI
jgi:hypothetical protein